MNEIGEWIYDEVELSDKKKGEGYYTVRLGDFNKMILSCHEDYALDNYDLLVEKDQGIVLAEEQYGIKKDIDQLFKNMRGRRASISSRIPNMD